MGKVHSLLIALTIISELTLSSLYLELEHSRTFHVRMYCVLLEVVRLVLIVLCCLYVRLCDTV